MENITIGIPRGLHYYKNKYLYLAFFKELGINVIISPQTDKEILEMGNKLNKEICLPLKVFIGHVKYLVDKVDYILIPNIQDECDYINYLYDITNNILNTKLIEYTMNDKKTEEIAFLKLGKKLGFGKEFILNAYNKAKKEEYKQNKINYLLQEKKLERSNKKILLIGNNYLLEDEMIKENILNKFKERDIDIIFSNIINPDDYFDEKTYKNTIKRNIQRLNNIINIKVIITTNPCVSKNTKKYENFFKIDDKYLIIDIDNSFFYNEEEILKFINDMETENE